MDSRWEFVEDIESGAKVEDKDGLLRWPELADSRQVGGWVDELEAVEDSAEFESGAEVEDKDGTLRWPEPAGSRQVGGWVDELEAVEDSPELEKGSEATGRAGAAAAAALAFLARCLRRSWRVVAFGCPSESLSSSRDSGTVPKTCLKREVIRC